MLTRFDPFAEMTRFQSEVARQLEGSRSFSPAAVASAVPTRPRRHSASPSAPNG